MTTTTRSVRAGVLAVFMAGALTATGLSAGVATGEEAPARDTSSVRAEIIHPELTAELREAAVTGDAVEYLVTLEAHPDLTEIAFDREAVVSALQQTAAESQEPVVDLVRSRGDEVVASFWLSNMVVVRSAPEVAAAITTVEGVDQLLPMLEVSIPHDAVEEVGEYEPVEPLGVTGTATVGETTWGIDKIQADRVWEELGVDGSGIRVAVLDTGVDISHPDLVDKMVTDDPADPSYPGGWMEWSAAGTPLLGQPRDSGQHGTHVAGTIHGGSTSGVAIGAAPGAEMMHGLVLPGGNGTFPQVVAGMQWAVDPYDATGAPAGRAADVLSMSLSAKGITLMEMAEPVRNIYLAGTLPVIATGNCGDGCDGSPGNSYEAFAIGATDVDDDVAAFSSGAVVHAAEFDNPPSDWPGSWVIPDVSAPGVDVLSSIPEGSAPGEPDALYARSNGTSMATPHVAATVALMLAGDPGLDAAALAEVLTGTSFFDSRHGDERPNTRFGHGRINAFAAVSEVILASGVAGSVTDADGHPITGATVRVVERGLSVSTGPHGDFSIKLPPGAYTLAISRFGFVDATVTDVVVAEDGTTSVDVPLEALPSGTLTGTVTDGETGISVPGVRVRIEGVPADLSAVTDGNGAYEISGVPVGDYQIAAHSSAAHFPTTAEVTVNDDVSTTTDLDLSPFGGVERMSVSGTGVEPNGRSARGQVNADGTVVAFDSEATNLTNDAVSGRLNVFIHDREAGATELVSVSSDGTPADAVSDRPSISDDGRFVAFQSMATNLVSPAPPNPETGGFYQIYVHDRLTGETELVSRTSDGEPAEPNPSGSTSLSNPWISGNGRFVTFASTSIHLLGPDHAMCPRSNGLVEVCRQILVHDRETGATEVVSRHTDGDMAESIFTTDPRLSTDGRHAMFFSQATNLVDEEVWPAPGDDDGGSSPIGFPFLHAYVHDRETGETEWVSVLGPDDLDEGVSPGVGSYGNTITDDGRHVTFTSFVHPEYTTFMNQTFHYDRQTGETTMLGTWDDPDEVGIGLSASALMSADASTVVFGVLVADVQGQIQPDLSGAFTDDLTTGERQRLVAPTYDGSPPMEHTPGPSSISPDGRYVVVDTTDPLTPGVTTSLRDVFLVDRHYQADEPRARFAVWGLDANPQVPLVGTPTEVAVSVTNIGNETGEHTAVLAVDGTAHDPRSVTLAPGESADLTWTITPSSVGPHAVQVGPATSQFRARTPVVELTVSAADLSECHGSRVTCPESAGLASPAVGAGEDGPGPLDGAAVSLITEDGGFVSVGSTDENGRLSFETPEVTGTYTVVVRRDASDDHPTSYLLTQSVEIDAADHELDIKPWLGLGASEQLLTLALHETGPEHGAITYLHNDQTGPYGFGFGAGEIVATSGAYAARVVHEVDVPDRIWWLVGDQVDIELTRPVVHQFGGPTGVELEASGGQGTSFGATWAAHDASGNSFEVIAAGEAESASLGSVVIFDEVIESVREKALHEAEVRLEIHGPASEVVATEVLTWEERSITRDLAAYLADPPPGEYSVAVTVETGVLAQSEVRGRDTFWFPSLLG